MEPASEPPDADGHADGLSLPVSENGASPNGSGHVKRRRDSIRPSAASVPGDGSHEGSPEEDMKKRLRGWSVDALRRKLTDQGESIAGLRKAELVDRLAKYGDAILSSPTQLIAPAGPVPKFAVHECEVSPPQPPTTSEKTKRGGARAGAGRKKKDPSTASPASKPRGSISEALGMPKVLPSTRRAPKRIADNPERYPSNSSLSSSASGSSISPALLILPSSRSQETHAEHNLNGFDGAALSSDLGDYAQSFAYQTQ